MNIVGPVFLVLGEGVEDEPGETGLEAARFRQYRHVRRQRAAIGGAGGLVVCERRREAIGEAAGPLKHFALIVGPIRHLEARRDSRRLLRGKTGTAGIGEIAERQKLQAVAVGTDLAVDLKAALQLLRVVGAERPVK